MSHWGTRSRFAPALVAVALCAALSGMDGIASAHADSDRGLVISDPATNVFEPLYVPALREPGRWVIGFDVGIGGLLASCTLCDSSLGGLSVDVQTGVTISRRVAVLLDVWTLLHPLSTEERSGLVSHTIVTPAARVWITPTIWMLAGAGASMLGLTTDGPDDYALSPSGMLGVGTEVRHDPDFGIDLSVRAGLGRYSDDDDGFVIVQLAALIGWHWY